MSLHVYSARCSWHGPIGAVATIPVPGNPRGPGLPCCPFCKSPLFQIDEDEWIAGAQIHQAEGHTHYVEFLDWVSSQQRCWPSLRAASADFTAATGKAVVWDV